MTRMTERIKSGVEPNVRGTIQAGQGPWIVNDETACDVGALPSNSMGPKRYNGQKRHPYISSSFEIIQTS